MNRTQYWCDGPSCGKLIEDKSVPKSSNDFTSESWEIWAPGSEVDKGYCSLDCLILGARELRMKASSENN